MRTPKKILIVDDSRAFITYITYLLRRMGFTKVIIAENGIEALKLLKIWTPDTVIMDVVMPGMDGITALEHMRADAMTANIPTILITAEPEREHIEACRRLGCEGYLTKPLEISALHDILQECVSKTGSNKRRYIRAAYEKKVTLVHEGAQENHFAVSLSEGGIYVRRRPPFEPGMGLEVIVPLEAGEPLKLKGEVIYKRVSSGSALDMPTGVAIEFEDASDEDTRRLRSFVTDLLARGSKEPSAEHGRGAAVNF